MERSPTRTFGFSAEDVAGWLRRRDELNTELTLLEKKLEAAALFMDEEARRTFFGTKGNAENTGSASALTMTAVIKEYLDKRVDDGGATYTELRQALEASPVGERLKRNPNALYNLVKTLEGRGEAVRRNGRVFAAGRVGGADDVLPAEESMTSAIVRIISETKGGISPAEIRQELSRNSDFKSRLEANPQYLYSTLARLSHRKSIKKIGSKYFGPEENGPSPESLFA